MGRARGRLNAVGKQDTRHMRPSGILIRDRDLLFADGHRPSGELEEHLHRRRHRPRHGQPRVDI
jgi:hypothetical protein